MTAPPILIGGMERSGTSLLRAIIGSNSKLAIFPRDLPLWTAFYPKYRHANLRDPSVARRLVHEIFATEAFRESQTGLEEKTILDRALATPALDAPSVFRVLLEEYARSVDRPRWGLKTPDNERVAGAIFAAHPDARMLHVVRDPRDAGLSYEHCGWGGWRYEPGRHIRKWKESVRLARENEKRFAGAYRTVCYEDLVTAPKDTVVRLCRFLGLEFEGSMLAMSGHARWSGDNSSFDDIERDARVLSPRAIGRYRGAMSKHVIRRYQRNLGPEMERLGYRAEPEAAVGAGDRIGYALAALWQQTRYALVCGGAALLRRTPLHDPVQALYRDVLKPSA